MTATALVLLHEGAEEMEVVIAVDVLRRGGVKVTLAAVKEESGEGNIVKCSRDVSLAADCIATSVSVLDHDLVVIPGGMGGARGLASSALTGEILRAQQERGKWVAAICAGPVAFVAHGISEGKRITSHPSVKEEIEKTGKYVYCDDERVVIDGKTVTSRGPGTAMEFGLALDSDGLSTVLIFAGGLCIFAFFFTWFMTPNYNSETLKEFEENEGGSTASILSGKRKGSDDSTDSSA
eukprot:Nk52_evm23s1569 gene=Nk52_evmTU23s1569